MRNIFTEYIDYPFKVLNNIIFTTSATRNSAN